jgi:hypothetical protein
MNYPAASGRGILSGIIHLAAERRGIEPSKE